MKKVKNSTNRKPAFLALLLRCRPLRQCPILLAMLLLLMGCSDFVEVETPKNILISETVFNDSATVESALANLYYDMREGGMVSGTYGLTPVLGIYSDELDYYGFNADYAQLFQHSVLSANTVILDWWKQAYHLIYGANDIVKGVGTSDGLTPDEKKVFKGQALFVRAYIHSLLVSLYGDVPYIKTTDYRENNTVSRMPRSEVYENIITDLKESVVLLEGIDVASPARALPDAFVAKAFLARMYLYVENWEMAASLATELIDAFQLEANLDQVFLKGSQETIWQLRADADFPKNTREAVQ
ncbi:RagB/SusD family nutrient uptake outer membrane protein, partial [Flagellimonas pacifica]